MPALQNDPDIREGLFSLEEKLTIQQVRFVAERLRDALAHTPVAIGDEEQIHFTVSMGVTEWQLADADIDATLHRADEALYRAKHNGRNRVEQA